MFIRPTLTLAAITTLSALTACGGGGDPGSASTGSITTATGTATGTTTSTNIVSTAGTLVKTPAASSYTSGSMAAVAYTTLNAARLASGTGAVTENADLDVAAQAHATYLNSEEQLNTSTLTAAQIAEITSEHDEASDVLPNLYYGATPLSRAILSGAIVSGDFDTELIAGASQVVNGQSTTDGSVCIEGVLHTVYHADGALSPATMVAIAQFADGLGVPACVVDLAASTWTGQVTPSGTAVLNPAPNTTVSGSFYIDGEIPRPAAGLIPRGTTAGAPVLFNARNADWINAAAAGTLAASVNSFTLTNSAGAPVDAVILASSFYATSSAINIDPVLEPGSLSLVPTAPLPAGVYTAAASVTIAPGVTLSKTWSFMAQ